MALDNWETDIYCRIRNEVGSFPIYNTGPTAVESEIKITYLEAYILLKALEFKSNHEVNNADNS